MVSETRRFWVEISPSLGGFNYALGLNNSHSVWGIFFIFDVYAVLWGWRFGVDPKGERHGRKRGKRGKGE